jgi:hypothetical protein
LVSLLLVGVLLGTGLLAAVAVTVAKVRSGRWPESGWILRALLVAGAVLIWVPLMLIAFALMIWT